MRIADMPRNALQVRVALHKVLEHLVLLLVRGLKRYAVLPVALAVIAFILPEVIRLNPQQNVHIRQALRAEITRLFPRPQRRAEIPVKGDGHALFFRHAQQIKRQLCAVLAQRRRDAGQVQPVKAIQQRGQIHIRKVIFRHSGMLAVVNHLARPNAIARLQIVCAQPVRRRFLRRGENHRRAVHIVGAQQTHCRLAQRVIRHNREERAVDAQIRQRQRNVCLRTTVGCLKVVRHAELLVVRRRQAEHDFTNGNEFLVAADIPQQRIRVQHEHSPFIRQEILFEAPPHNSAARLAMSFPPSAACKFLDLHPVNLRNLHLHLTKNPFASRPPHLCGVTLNFPQALRVPKWRGVNRSSLLRQKCNSNYACKRAKISRSSARASSLRSMHRAIALIAVSPVMSRIDFSSPQ